MKLKELKLSHIIKTAVFGILMLFPFLAGASKCIYVAANKNAYQNYSGKDYVEYEQINSFNDIIINQYYYFDTASGTYSNTSTENTNNIKITDIQNVNSNDYTWNNYMYDENLAYIRFYYSSSYMGLYGFDESNTQLFGRSLSTNNLSFTFKLLSFSNDLSSNYTFLQKYELGNYYNLDNAFYYANEQVWEEPLFNWVESSALQTSIGAFVSVFGLTVGSYFNNLITYWLSLTIIFIVINLVLDVIEWLIDLAPFKKKKS